MVAQPLQQFIAAERSSQFGTCQTAACDNQLVTKIGFLLIFNRKTRAFSFYFLNFKAGHQLDIGFPQSKTQHIHHGIGLVGIGIDPAGGLCHRVKTHIFKPLQGIFHRITGQRRGSKLRLIAVIVVGTSSQIGQIAAAVSGGQQLTAHPGLPLKKQHLDIFIFCGG